MINAGAIQRNDIALPRETKRGCDWFFFPVLSFSITLFISHSLTGLSLQTYAISAVKYCLLLYWFIYCFQKSPFEGGRVRRRNIHQAADWASVIEPVWVGVILRMETGESVIWPVCGRSEVETQHLKRSWSNWVCSLERKRGGRNQEGISVIRGSGFCCCTLIW